jgi:hypothetical protein
MMLPGAPKVLQHPRRSWRRSASAGKYLVLKGLLVDLIGIEAMTSSMPWNHQKRKLLTVKWLEVGKTGKTGKTGQIAPL